MRNRPARSMGLDATFTSCWRFVIAALAGIALFAPAPGTSGAAQAPLLAFTRDGDVHTIRADGAGSRLLLRRAYSPAWSPDGSRLAFVSGRSGDEEIYVASADGKGVRRLTRAAGPDLNPAWSPDGRRLLWSRNAEIWTMSASGADRATDRQEDRGPGTSTTRRPRTGGRSSTPRTEPASSTPSCTRRRRSASPSPRAPTACSATTACPTSLPTAGGSSSRRIATRTARST